LQRLSAAQTFVEVATIVCVDASMRFDLCQCCVSLHAANGQPVVAIDNVPGVADELRRAWVDTDMWRGDPMLRALAEHRAPVSGDNELLLPLVEPAGLIGSIRCVRRDAFSVQMIRDLSVLSVHVSVRLAQLGISTHGTHPLSPRQHDVADLAARGFSNIEIAQALAISENTVKKQLKEVYRRLEIANRTELARMLRSPVVSDAEAPIGVTHVGALTITRGVGSR
jgi:DNA-binding CsgD family transcriptional regulator